jgi:hypothetical protein
MMDPERPDLSAFEWDDAARWERMVKHIMWRSSAELERHRLAGTFGLFDGLLAWARPALATAAALTLISLYALLQSEAGPGASLSGAFFRSAALPGALETWLEAGEPPTANFIVLPGGEN